MARNDPQAPAVEFRFFGAPAVFMDGKDATSSFSKRALWMIAMLAFSESKSIDRQHLASSLWPDSSDTSALHNLRQTLAAVRRSLGDAKELVSGGIKAVELRLSPEVAIDVLDFDANCKESSPASLEKAVEVFRGDLLSGCDEPFAIVGREQREHAFVAAADRLVANYLETGSVAAAIPVLRRILSQDPYRETACRSLMASLAEIGEWPAALEYYREFRRRLRNELKCDVSAETKATYRSIRTNAATGLRKKESKHDVPVPLTELIGRQTEIATVTSLIQRCRLVTLSGPGGVGKTRLAIAVANHVAESYLDGAYFVDLAPLSDTNTIVAAIAKALSLNESVGKSFLEQITDFVAERELILVLDNCEHVANEVARLSEQILSSGSGLQILATSRQSLGVRGEFVWNVPALTTPKVDDEASAVLDTESVQLFMKCDRRESSQRRDGDVQVIAAICRRLDGLPLAIELAAARTNVLAPQEIEKRLDSRFSLLTGGSGQHLRHQTLNACIEWSWEALSDDAKSLLMILSAFRGGCNLAAIEAVAGDELRSQTLDLMSILVDRSLVRVSDAEGETRYSLLETIREFASGKLKERGAVELVCDRHRDYFLQWAIAGNKKMQTPEEAEWFTNFERDHDNLRRAIAWCYSRAHEEQAVELTCMLCRFWDTTGHLQEGRDRIERALQLAAPQLPKEMHARARLHAGWMAGVQGDHESAIRHYEAAIPIFAESDEKWALAATKNCLAESYRDLKQYDAAEKLYWEAIEIKRSMGTGGWATPLCNLADMALAQGNYDRAYELINESLRELGGGPRKEYPQLSGLVLSCLSLTEFCTKKFSEARQHAIEALRFFHESGQVISVPHALLIFAFAESGVGNWDVATRLMGACDTMLKAQSTVLSEHILLVERDVRAQAKRVLESARFDALFQEGSSMNANDAAEYVLRLELIAI